MDILFQMVNVLNVLLELLLVKLLLKLQLAQIIILKIQQQISVHHVEVTLNNVLLL